MNKNKTSTDTGASTKKASTGKAASRKSNSTSNLNKALEAVHNALNIPCPHCPHPTKVYAHARLPFRRYRCTKCGSTFAKTYGTLLHRAKKRDEFEKYVQCFNEGCSIRGGAQSVGVSTPTAFAWRHKVLAAVGQNSFVRQMNGVVEAVEMKVDYSQKGAWESKLPKDCKTMAEAPQIACLLLYERLSQKSVMLMVDKNKIDWAKETRKLRKQYNSEWLLTKAEGDATEKMEIKNHSKANVNRRKLGMVNGAQRIVEGYQNWVKKFRGIASRYLQNYLWWHSLNQQLTKQKQPLKKLFEILMNSAKSNAYYFGNEAQFAAFYLR